MQFHFTLVVAGSLAAGIHAFAPIWCMNRVLMPKTSVGPFGALAFPQPLMIAHIPDSTSPSTVPYFEVGHDHAITWHDKGVCLEATAEHVVQLNHCTGEDAQKWNWIPGGHGQHRIQHINSNMCLDVPDGEGVVGLRGCENQGMEVWMYEKHSSMPTQSLSKMRHVMISLLALAWTGLVGLSTWRWNSRRRAAAQLVNVAGSKMTGILNGDASTGDGNPPSTPTRKGHISMAASASAAPGDAGKSFWSWRVFGGGLALAGTLIYAGVTLPLKVLLPVLGNFTAVAIYYSSCPGLLDDRKQEKLTTDPLPYPFACISALVNALYAAAINDVLLFVPNFLGVAATTFNTTTVLRLCRDQRLALKMEMTLALGLGVLAAAFLTTMTPLVFADAVSRIRLLGNLNMALVTIMFASPVIGAFKAARSRDGSELNMPLAFAQFANGILWCFYGVMKRDVVIFGPAGAGAILALITILVKFSIKRR